MSQKPITLKIEDLDKRLFVRTRLNEDHTLFLAGLIENGTDLEPIKVALIEGRYVVIDGRHRIEAYELNKRTEIMVLIVNVESEMDLIGASYRANLGGSLPPTPQDTEHTISLLLDRATPRKHIAEMLGLPVGMVRNYLATVQSKMARVKLTQAIGAIADGGLTIVQAAEKYGVPVESLKEAMSGRKKKLKHGVAEIQRDISPTPTGRWGRRTPRSCEACSRSGRTAT